MEGDQSAAPIARQGRIAVVGAGIIGLSCALALVDDGHQVVVFARNLEGDLSTEWCSPWAGALLAPHPDAELPDLQTRSLEMYQQLLHDSDTGVKEIGITEYYDDRPPTAPIWYQDHVRDCHRIAPEKLPLGVTLGLKYVGMVANPSQLLPWMMRQLRARGVTFVTRTVSSLDEALKAAGASIVINASGVGAADLANDEKVRRVRGQTMVVESRGFDRVEIRQGSEYTYAIPRPSEGVVILGGVSQPDSSRETPDPSLREDILRRVNDMTGGAFAWVNIDRDVKRDIVGFRPGRDGGLRLERDGRVIHAYGVKSLGYLYAFGVADRVKTLVGRTHTSRL